MASSTSKTEMLRISHLQEPSPHLTLAMACALHRCCTDIRQGRQRGHFRHHCFLTTWFHFPLPLFLSLLFGK